MRNTYVLYPAYSRRADFDPVLKPDDSAHRDENACDEILYELLGGECHGEADDSERGGQSFEIQVKNVIDADIHADKEHGVLNGMCQPLRERNRELVVENPSR